MSGPAHAGRHDQEYEDGIEVPRDRREEFARAVAGTSSFCIKVGVGSVGWPDPYPVDEPVVVVTYDDDRSYWTLAFDFDSKYHPDAPTLARRLFDAAEASGCLPVICASGSPGSRHVFVRMQRPLDAEVVSELRAQVTGMFGRMDGSPRTAIRPPGAVHHKSSATSRLLEPSDVDAALNRMRTGASAESVEVFLVTIPPSPILTSQRSSSRSRQSREGVPAVPDRSPVCGYERVDRWTRSLIRNGDSQDKFRGDRSAMLLAICANYQWFGLDFESLVADVTFFGDGPVGDKIAEVITERGMDGLRDYLWCIWVAARDERPPASQFHESRFMTAEEILWSSCWPGTGSVGARLVFAGYVFTARRLDRVVYDLSHRDLALRVGLDPTTVLHHQREVRQRRLVRPLGQGQQDWAPAWLLLPDHSDPVRADDYQIKNEEQEQCPLEIHKDNISTYLRTFRRDTCDYVVEPVRFLDADERSLATRRLARVVSHDAFTRKALGPEAALIWAVLPEAGCAIPDLQDVFRWTRRRVRKYLERLEARGLVEIRDEQCLRREGDLFVIADHFGTTGTWERRNDRIARDRERRRDELHQDRSEFERTSRDVSTPHLGLADT